MTYVGHYSRHAGSMKPIARVSKPHIPSSLFWGNAVPVGHAEIVLGKCPYTLYQDTLKYFKRFGKPLAWGTEIWAAGCNCKGIFSSMHGFDFMCFYESIFSLMLYNWHLGLFRVRFLSFCSHIFGKRRNTKMEDSYKDMIDHRSYAHNLINFESSSEIKG